LAERRYTKSHEWIAIEGNVATVGITDFAQAQLGDVVFLELPKIGNEVGAGAAFGVIESVKAANDLFSPATGKIVEVNERLSRNPELVNSDPYGEGWIMKVELAGGEPGELLDEGAYKAFAESETH